MHKPTIIATTALVLSSAFATAQGTPSEGSLARARALFEKVDLDDDGLISAREAGRSQIPSRDFVVHDADRDRSLSGEEFLIFYRQLLVRAGKGVSPDLESEAARIQALRRAKETEKAQKRIADARDKKSAEDAKRAEAARQAEEAKRIQDAREKKAEEDAARIAAAREKALQERTDAARDDLDQAEADRIAAAREQKQQDDAKRIETARGVKPKGIVTPQGTQQGTQQGTPQGTQQGTQQKDLLRQRADAAREQKAADDAKRIAAAREKSKTSKGMTPAERAQAYVKRLVDGGRLTTQQARDFYAALLAEPGAKTDPEAESLRSSLKRAKDRIGDLVRGGHLSAEEGRQLAAQMDARVKVAIPNGPAQGRRGVVEPVRPRDGSAPKGTAPPKGGTKNGAQGANRSMEVKKKGKVITPAKSSDGRKGAPPKRDGTRDDG